MIDFPITNRMPSPPEAEAPDLPVVGGIAPGFQTRSIDSEDVRAFRAALLRDENSPAAPAGRALQSPQAAPKETGAYALPVSSSPSAGLVKPDTVCMEASALAWKRTSAATPEPRSAFAGQGTAALPVSFDVTRAASAPETAELQPAPTLGAERSTPASVTTAPERPADHPKMQPSVNLEREPEAAAIGLTLRDMARAVVIESRSAEQAPQGGAMGEDLSPTSPAPRIALVTLDPAHMAPGVKIGRAHV